MTFFVQVSGQPVVFRGITQLTGVQISIYDAGTLTPRQAFKDGLAISSWSQPIPGDSNGCIPNIWCVGAPIKVRIVAAQGAYTREIDFLPGDTAPGGGGGGGGGGTAVTGDLVKNYGTSIITGRVRANGGTIGNGASSATERANDDTLNLFVWLYSDANLVVSGGRSGSGAVADFGNNKTITLPDFKCRSDIGIDDMGTGPSGRLAGALFSTGDAETLGSTGGEAVHTLTITETAAHTHSGTTAANTAFQMSFTTNAASAGTPSGSIVAAGSHTHSVGLENANHQHDFAAMSFAGSHNHGGLTGGSDTFFTMNSVGTSLSQSSASVPTVASGAGGFVSVLTSSTLNLSTSGTWLQDHHHSISADGSHVHAGLTGLENATHSHSLSTGGNHTHTFTGTAMATHAHTGSTDLGGIHQHAFTTASAGSGGAHNTMPPFVLVTVYLVL